MDFANSSLALERFVAKVSGRSAVAIDEAEAVLALRVVPRRISAHREFVQLGQAVDHACLVADGLVARFALMPDGRRQLISFHIPGDIADLDSLMLSAASTSLVALTPTAVFQIPHAALRDLAADFPALAVAFWRECVIDGNIVAQWLVGTGRRNARGRIAHLLCEMAVRYDFLGMLIGGRFPFPVTQEQIADASGLTPVHVNRSLKALRQEGIAQLTRTEAVILDWPALVAAGEFDRAYLHLPPRQSATAFAVRPSS